MGGINVASGAASGNAAVSERKAAVYPPRDSLRLSRDGGMFWRDDFTHLAGLMMRP
jgi:hypothetical protein